jgi:hypothetical protein
VVATVRDPGDMTALILRRLDDEAVVEPHLIDRDIAEITDVPDLPGHAVVGCRRQRLLRDAHFLRPQRDPYGVARLRLHRRARAQLPGRGARDHRPGRSHLDHAAFDQVDLADELRDPARVRLLVDFGRRGDLDQAAMVHDADAIGDRHRLLLVVGDDDKGEAELLLQLHQLELRLAAQLLVERRERLVEQQDAGALHQRARQRVALALAAGELVRLALAEAVELDQCRHLRDARRDLILGKALLLEPECGVASTVRCGNNA